MALLRGLINYLAKVNKEKISTKNQEAAKDSKENKNPLEIEERKESENLDNSNTDNLSNLNFWQNFELTMAHFYAVVQIHCCK